MHPADLNKFRQAAAIAAQVREFVAGRIVPGAKLIDVALAGHELIAELGGKPAFPLQISRNEIAAHYCPYIGDPTTFEEGDLVKTDVGVHVDGFVADTALSKDLSPDGRYSRHLDAAREALEAAIRTAGPGVEVVEIGRAVEQTIRSFGLRPVRNLTGHGIDRWCIHRSPQIPNVPSGRGTLKAGTLVAIEPFATDGEGIVLEKGDAHVFLAKKTTRKGKETDPQVLEAIRTYNGLPFGSRDLVQRFPYRAVAATLNALARADHLVVYPPLCEKPGRMVAQFEHTLYIGEDGVEVLTRLDPARAGAAAAGVTGGAEGNRAGR